MNTGNRMEKNAAIARAAAAEGMVLLQNNDHLLPLKEKTSVAVFGIGQVHTIYGGTGSGEVNNLKSVSILEGLRASGLQVDERLAQQYENWALAHPRRRQGMFAGEESRNYNDEMPLAQTDSLAAGNDAAVIVISRIAGEGEDMKPEKGMIFLTDEEEALLDAVTAAFADTVLVLNTAGYMEIASYLPKVKSVLFCGLPGQEAGHAVADILTGKMAVGGKLSSTWPLTYKDFPNSETYSTFIPSGNVCAGGFATGRTEQTLVPYHDDIYVGYRYFDTFGVDVLYPFGYGLSYGRPEISQAKVSMTGEEICVEAVVKNSCDTYAASEVVQVYVSAPDGRLEKPYQELKGYQKSAVLSPGEEQAVSVRFSLRDLASYDMAQAAYILEPGLYYIRVGASSRSTVICGAVEVKEEQRTVILRNLLGEVPEDFSLLSRAGKAPISYTDEAQKKAEAAAHALNAPQMTPQTVTYDTVYTPVQAEGVTLADVLAGRAAAQELVASMSLEDLCRFVCGQGMDMSGFDLSAMAPKEEEPEPVQENTEEGSEDIFASLAVMMADKDTRFEVAGEAGQSPDLRDAYGIPPMVLADGPAGVRLTRDLPDGTHQYCTAFPTGSLLACTFRPELLEQFGAAAGEEMNEYGVDLWLAPGMNIYRSALCGRNFEYYSEDPVVTGQCAAAVTKGVQRMGGGVTIKHFAANSQEFMRGNSNDIVTERALREIYLKGFEICVRSADPKAVMTSYNDINGVPNADNEDLLGRILREEWGFNGLVMTDWGGGVSQPAISVCVGNDMIQPGGKAVSDSLLAAVRAGKAVTSRGMAHKQYVPTRADLERSALHILHVILRCKSALDRVQ